MKNAIILHGQCDKEEYYDPQYPSPSNLHWLPWLQKQLLMRDIAAATPEVPNSYSLDYGVWKKEFERYDVTPGTMLVAHSTGAAFVLRWLSEHLNQTADKLVFVAPCIVPDGQEEEAFYRCTWDPELTARVDNITIFVSTDDSEHIQESAQVIAEKFPTTVTKTFEDKGHFSTLDEVFEIPELLDELIKQ